MKSNQKIIESRFQHLQSDIVQLIEKGYHIQQVIQQESTSQREVREAKVLILVEMAPKSPSTRSTSAEEFILENQKESGQIHNAKFLAKKYLNLTDEEIADNDIMKDLDDLVGNDILIGSDEDDAWMDSQYSKFVEEIKDDDTFIMPLGDPIRKANELASEEKLKEYQNNTEYYIKRMQELSGVPFDRFTKEVTGDDSYKEKTSDSNENVRDRREGIRSPFIEKQASADDLIFNPRDYTDKARQRHKLASRLENQIKDLNGRIHTKNIESDGSVTYEVAFNDRNPEFDESNDGAVVDLDDGSDYANKFDDFLRRRLINPT